MEINNNKIVVQNLIGIVLYISIEIKSFAPKSAPSSTA